MSEIHLLDTEILRNFWQWLLEKRIFSLKMLQNFSVSSRLLIFFDSILAYFSKKCLFRFEIGHIFESNLTKFQT
jgi:hypothetical protein